MSHRPIETKQRRRVVKSLRREAPPASFDLVKYLVDNKHAASKKAARQMIIDGKVTHDGAKVGIIERPYLTMRGGQPSIEKAEVLSPLVPFVYRDEIKVEQ